MEPGAPKVPGYLPVHIGPVGPPGPLFHPRTVFFHPMDFVVLSSSRGTTFQAVLDRIADGTLTAKCLGLISDREDRGCVAKARAAGIPVKIVSRSEGESRDEYDKKLHTSITELHPPGETKKRSNEETVIAALGWMFIFTPWFVARWRNRIINVHPALLPKFGGKGMYGDKVHQAVLDAKENESGISIHVMDEGVDTGPILRQETCPVLPGDTVETLKAKVQALEKEWYPRVLEMIHRGEIRLPGSDK